MPDEMEEIIAEFIAESEETLDQVEPLLIELESKGQDRETLNRLFRCVHTIKGAAGFLGFQQIVDVAHGAENIMKKLRDGEIALSTRITDVFLKSVDMLKRLLLHIKTKDGVSEDTVPIMSELSTALAEASSAQNAGQDVTIMQADKQPVHHAPSEQKAASSHVSEEKKEEVQTLRVETEKIDKVMDLTGEVVLARNRLVNIAHRLERRGMEDKEIAELVEAVSFLNLVASEMQVSVMKMRMQPLRKVFNKFPRLLRDIATTLGKSVELQISGEDTEVDKSVIEQIGDPLVHILRNAVDHGMEHPSERKALGKPEKGIISINAYQKGNQIVIEIADDGRGIDIDRIKKKAVEKGIITDEEAARMQDEAAINIIFMPGFSTAEKATEISGRGVGMDVVKTNISRLNGSVDVVSRKGQGTKFIIRLPLTVAIIQTLMVRAGGLRYAIPLAPVEETMLINEGDVRDLSGTRALVIHGRVHQLVDLASLLGHPRRYKSEQVYAVVVSIADKRFAIEVDGLVGQEEIVIKRMEGLKTSSSYVLGATITGDGRVVFVLDLASVSRTVSDTVRV